MTALAPADPEVANVVEVAVTLPVPGRYITACRRGCAARAQVGARVLVRFGARKVTGVVVRDGTAPPDGIEARRARPTCSTRSRRCRPSCVELCLWIADYYEAPPGEVMRARAARRQRRGGAHASSR